LPRAVSKSCIVTGISEIRRVSAISPRDRPMDGAAKVKQTV
jgi:hypothetical protein